MTFHIGQRVVCITDMHEDYGSHWALCCPNRPRKGEVYTIRGTETIMDVTGCWLEEIVNPIKENWGCGCGPREPGFLVENFRPLIERKTDISAFHELLAPTSPRVLEDV
jgi:hypothetical protein